VMFAYADPPYVGCAGLYPEKAEVDHAALIRRLVPEYPDGWALSCSSPSLAYLLRLCHENGAADVRTLAWVKPFAVFKPNVGLAYAWEPVLFHGGRRRTREQPTIRDWFSAPITLRRGLVGAKPEAFCRWILAALNFQPGDTLDDLFPGTGVMGRTVAQGDLLASGGAP
jgi:hypothetical protein